MGLAPSAAWTVLPVHPLRLRTPPPHQPGPHPPGALQKEPGGGWGEEGRGTWGGKGCGQGRVLQFQWGGWRGPSKQQLGPDPHLGALDYSGGTYLGTSARGSRKILKSLLKSPLKAFSDSLKTLISLNKEVRPFFFPKRQEHLELSLSVSSLSDYRIWRS